MLKLGSLFDGIGGFPLAGTYCDITPVWASEIEPEPVSITKRHFPEMKHLGDITKINGAEIEPVDIITFGSPCQDLSIAGKRAGMKHEGKGDEETTRSGLFLEAVRIIREMREATNGEYPTFAVWENVPGAFSSNKGEDFRTVLEEICKIKDRDAVVPRPPKGKWADAGEIVADGYSIAWRVLDAQFWGVPQRRRRIYLVADFADNSAAEILFKREGLSWHTATGRAQREGVAADVKTGIGAASNGGIGIICAATQQGGAEIREDNISPTLTAAAGMSGNNQPYFATYCLQGNGIDRTVDRPAVYDMTHANDVIRECGEMSPTLQSRMGTGGNQVPIVQAIDCRNHSANNDVSGTIQAKGNGGQSLNFVKQWGDFLTQNAVRRLTPLECERLQGFPDGWTEQGHDGKPISDSARYKALGNSLAIPCAFFVLHGIAKAT